MSFPLYDALRERYLQASALGEAIDVAGGAAAIADIKCKCSPEDCLAHYETVAALALHHWTKANPDAPPPSAFPYPHKPVHQGKGIMVEMRNLPIVLQGILSLYVEHFKS